MFYTKYEALLLDLLQEADQATDPMKAALYYRDAVSFSYLWETGQRGKECTRLVLHSPTHWLIRPSDAACTQFMDKALGAGSVGTEIQLHLQRMQLWVGETCHSLRRGGTQMERY
eukprot:scaffold331220_cov47-Prasinocladus_malaysianus.AAC.2